MEVGSLKVTEAGLGGPSVVGVRESLGWGAMPR